MRYLISYLLFQYVTSEKRHCKSTIIYIEYTCCVICRILYQFETGSTSSYVRLFHMCIVFLMITAHLRITFYIPNAGADPGFQVRGGGRT